MMEYIPEQLQSETGLLILAVVLAAIIGGGYYLYKRYYAAPASTAAQTIATSATAPAHKPNLLFFHQTTCAASKAAHEVMRQVEAAGLAKIEYVNCDSMSPPPAAVMKYGVESVPFLINLPTDDLHVLRKFSAAQMTIEAVREFIALGLEELKMAADVVAETAAAKPDPEPVDHGLDLSLGAIKVPAPKLNLDMDADSAELAAAGTE